jgi:hypothetical protein
MTCETIQVETTSFSEIISLCYFPVLPLPTTFRFSKPTHSEHALQIHPSPDSGSSCFSQSGTFFRPSVQGQCPLHYGLGRATIWGKCASRQRLYFEVVGGEWWNINVLGAYSSVALSHNKTLMLSLPTAASFSNFTIPWEIHSVSGMTCV